jgi:hypothetical protein
VEEDGIEEEDDAKHKVDVLDEEDKEVELDVDGNVLDDHVNNEIIENETNDDVAMANPYNVDSELDFGPNDADLELDEEQYQ